MEISKNNPKEFAFNEICALSIQAGVSRLKNVYTTKDNAKRKKWRRKVHNILYKVLESIYSADNISCIENFIKDTSDNKVLQNRKLTFGVAQKIYNLFFKYCWSL